MHGFLYSIQFERIVRRNLEARSVKEEKIEKLQRLRKKEAAANKAFGGFSGKVTLGKFAILEESDNEDTQPQKEIDASTATSTSSPMTEASLPIKTRQKHKAKTSTKLSSKKNGTNSTSLIFLACIAFGACSLLVKTYL